MSWIRVEVKYTKEINYPGTLEDFSAMMHDSASCDKTVKRVIEKPMAVETKWSDEESRKQEKRFERMEEIFSNMGEKEFPEGDPVEFLKKYPSDFWDENSEDHPGKCITVWEPFEQYPAEKLVKYINGEGLWD